MLVKYTCFTVFCFFVLSRKSSAIDCLAKLVSEMTTVCQVGCKTPLTQLALQLTNTEHLSSPKHYSTNFSEHLWPTV